MRAIRTFILLCLALGFAGAQTACACFHENNHVSVVEMSESDHCHEMAMDMSDEMPMHQSSVADDDCDHAPQVSYAALRTIDLGLLPDLELLPVNYVQLPELAEEHGERYAALSPPEPPPDPPFARKTVFLN
ncbi:hypothetical protein [Ponticaulis sp.]|uniref:hypothetical protein n=1 Tax=Ponticaulis sp. TaxID=2020902 RepID=UPI000B66221B|nr:hypothetical protein [Ponticaulis sp.]MAI89277.1 hypothetical protein [Ponticaulis sp.]OUY01263.1 MAG: hypothetical protein CBB65_02180 [Hyphomonadaceae bacterium TMED5]|tara:strand:- start:9600 stop:9995 length:396 start_codon:yes stop_codon:yes gene_type:complete